MPITPIAPLRLYQKVAEQLARLVAAGELPVGSRLPAERELAQSLGVSRPVVREAMIALELAGVVEVRMGSGAWVVHAPSPDLVTGGFARALADAGSGPLALVELQNATAPSTYTAGTQNFYVVTRYNWSSYYALAVIELGETVRQMMGER